MTNPEVSVEPTQDIEQAAREAAARVADRNGGRAVNGNIYAAAYRGALAALAHQPPPATQPIATVGARWRPEVVGFADLMERQLRANDHKPGWKDDEPFDLQERVEQEAAELSTAVAEWERHTGHTEAALSRAVGREAADVANMAMMVADVCGALHTPPPVATATVVDAGWQDIATAPKDGSPLLIYAEDLGIHIGSWETHFGRSGWAVGSDDTAPEDCYTVWAEPTHWRATPTPPAGGSDGPHKRAETSSGVQRW